jgi:hypothetical protein
MTDQSGAAAHVSGGATPVAYTARQNPGDRVRPNPLVLRFHMPSPLAPQASCGRRFPDHITTQHADADADSSSSKERRWTTERWQMRQVPQKRTRLQPFVPKLAGLAADR